jgi:hypothetical protein
MKKLVYILCACLLAAACNITPKHKPVNHASFPKKQQKAVAFNVPDDTIRIAAVGDIMLGSSYPDNKTLPPDSGRNSFKYAADYLRGADVAFGNLEGVLLDTGAAIDYKLKSLKPSYLFRTPVSYAPVFKNAGFNILSLGNNHINDFSVAGRKSTVKVLDSLGIYFAGLYTRPTATFTVKGIKYGFCAFSPNSQTVSLLDIKKAKTLYAG